MKIQDLSRALEGVPGALRQAAEHVRQSRALKEELEKTAALRKLRKTMDPDERDADGSDDDAGILDGVPPGAIEKIARGIASRSPIGRAIDSPDQDRVPEGRDERDARFLEGLRNL
jgi:hypothetical protein